MIQTILAPRVSETDGSRHINNTTIPIWLEAGRNELFELFTPGGSFEKWKLVIVNTNITYVAQLFYGRPVTVNMWVQKIGTTSLALYEEIHQDGRLGVKAHTTYVNFDFGTQKSEPIPQHLRDALSVHLYQA